MKSFLENNKLIQKDGKNFRTFQLVENGLITEYRQDSEYAKFEIEFESIGFKEIIANKNTDSVEMGLYFSFIFNLILGMYVLNDLLDNNLILTFLNSGGSMGIVAVISVWANSLFKKEFVKHLKGEKTISFYYRKQEMELVDQFIETIKSAKKVHFRNTYLNIDDHIPIIEQKQTFLWLYKNKQIEKDELENILKKLENIRIIKGE